MDGNKKHRLWLRVQHILRAAHDCDTFQQDENAWSDIVKLVIRTAIFNCTVDVEDGEADFQIANMWVLPSHVKNIALLLRKLTQAKTMQPISDR
jgi:hypothetical protein